MSYWGFLLLYALACVWYTASSAALVHHSWANCEPLSHARLS